MIIIFLYIAWFVGLEVFCIASAVELARDRGRDQLAWGLAAFFFGIFAVIVVGLHTGRGKFAAGVPPQSPPIGRISKSDTEPVRPRRKAGSDVLQAWDSSWDTTGSPPEYWAALSQRGTGHEYVVLIGVLGTLLLLREDSQWRETARWPIDTEFEYTAGSISIELPVNGRSERYDFPEDSSSKEFAGALQRARSSVL